MDQPVAMLPLAGAVLDPQTERRGDDDWVAAQWDDPRSRLLVFAGERVAARDEAPSPAVAWFHPSQVPTARSGNWVVLGIDPDGRPTLATDLGQDADADVLGDAARFLTVRELGIAAAHAPDFGAVITAVALLNWHRRHPRCPLCGEPTTLSHAGWQRQCPADGSQHFPRVDPAVIMLAIDDQDRALLGRQRRWPPLWYSTLAGFVEPGETVETAVRREVREEVGVTIGAVTYLASQPWPFPSSLMLGFHAQALDAQLAPDGEEISDARWFTRHALAEACDRGEIRLPPSLSISRWLIERWYGAVLPGDWSRS